MVDGVNYRYTRNVDGTKQKVFIGEDGKYYKLENGQKVELNKTQKGNIFHKAKFETAKTAPKAVEKSQAAPQQQETVQVDENNTKYYQDGKLVKSEFKDENSSLTKEYMPDGKTLKSAYEEKTENGVTTKAKTTYFEGKKNSKEIETDNEKTTVIYNPALGNELPTRQVKRMKEDENSTETTTYSNYGEGQARTETIEYKGQYVKDGVTKRVIEYDKDGNVVSDTPNPDETPVQTETQQEKANQPETKEPAKFKVPQGWGMKQIAKAHGISVEDLLKANVDVNGQPTYKTSKNGVNYFLKDQEINLPEGAKFDENYKPQTTAAKTAPTPKTVTNKSKPVKLEKPHTAAADKTPKSEVKDDKPNEEWQSPIAPEQKAETQEGFIKPWPLKTEEGFKPWTPRTEKVQVPLIKTPEQQAEADAAKKAKEAKQKAAKDFEARLSGKKMPFKTK